MTMQDSSRIPPPVFKFRKMKFMSMVFCFFSATFLQQFHGVMSSQDAAKSTVNFVPPTEVNQEHQYKRYDNFPVPKLENVYKAWKPVDHGHPLKDETLFYAPPSMERVRFQHEANGPQSRSIDDDIFHPQPRRDQAIVIPAQPKKEPPKQGYSVYGSPDINYSALYTSKPPKPPHHHLVSHHQAQAQVPPAPRHSSQNIISAASTEPHLAGNHGRENPYLAFQRDYQNSALDSRSADTRDYPLLWGNYDKKEESALAPVKSHGGGLQMIKPPNKKKKKQTEYFYYSDTSEYYREKLNKPVNQDAHDRGNEIISIDGIVVGTRNEQQQKQQQQTLPSYPEDLVPQASVRHPATPPPSAPSTKANVQIYSFKNDFGQREHVGVIFDGSSAPGPQVSKLLPSNKHHVLQHHHQHQAAASRHDRGHHYEPGVAVGHGAAGINGVGAADQVDHHQVQNLANFIPLEKKLHPEEQVKSQEQSFPLGNPFGGPRLKARPEFFPPLQYPPLFKTKPQNLEGSFGPALPPKPEPDVIHFADEVLPGVVREKPNPATHHHRENNQAYQYQRPINTHQASGRSPGSQLPPAAPPVVIGRDNYVYKTVRGMEYSRPKDILHVKPSGELYIPDPQAQHAPYGDISPRVPILPGVSTLEEAAEWEALQQEGHIQPSEETADDRAWLPDFSDTEQQQQQSQHVNHNSHAEVSGQNIPTLQDFFGGGINHPLDLDTGSSVSDPIIFSENQYQRPAAGSGFKFPGKSTISLNDAGPHGLGVGHHHHHKGNMEPPPALVRKPTGAVKDESNPDYRVVIGLTYDDEGPDQVVRDYESDFSDEPTTTSKPFGKKELYDICIAEVPQHLHRDLCGYIQNGKIPEAGKATKTLQPRPSKLIQGVPPSAVLSGQFVKTTHHDPFAGIPTELPKQINKKPLVITSNSKVKIYRPFGEAPVTVTPQTPPTTPFVAPPAPITTATPTPIITAPPRSHTVENKRPLLFNKRDPNTGETRISKPFEYFNRLTQFFNNRVQQPAVAPSSGGSLNRRRLPPPPRLQRHRLRSPPPMT